MNCETARRLLVEQPDRPLTPDESAALRRHLAVCAACRDFERALSAGLAGLRVGRSIPDNPRVRAEVHRYVASQAALENRRGGHSWFRQAGGFAGAALVVALVAVLVSIMLRGLGTAGPQAGVGPAAGPTQTVPGTAPSPANELRTTSGFATPAPSPAPAIDEQTAIGEVERYYQRINARDYAAAYALLGAGLQKGQPLADFATGFAKTARDRLQILSTQAAAIPGHRTVSVQITAGQTDGSTKWFSGSYEVGYEDGLVKIVGAKVFEIPGPAGTPTPAAPPCGLDQIEPAVSAQGVSGDIAIAVRVLNHGAPCELTTTLIVSIESPGGQLLPIDGNGVVVPFRLPSLPTGGASTTFLWRNWCGSSAKVMVTVTAGDKTARIEQSVPPRCDSPGSRSSLEQVVNPS